MGKNIYRFKKYLVADKPCGIGSGQNSKFGRCSMRDWLELHLDYKSECLTSLSGSSSGLVVYTDDKLALNEDSVVNVEYYFFSKNSSVSLSNEDENIKFALIDSGSGCFLYKAEVRMSLLEAADFDFVEIAKEYGYSIVSCSYKSISRFMLHCSSIEIDNEKITSFQAIPDSFKFMIDGVTGVKLGAALAFERRGFLLNEITDAFRLIHRGEIGEFSVDFYNRYLLITGFDESGSAENMLDELKPVIDFFSNKYGVKGGAVRKQVRNPHNRKLFSDFALFGEEIPADLTVEECGVRYNIVLNKSQHTGLFLDQRDSRKRIMKLAEGRRVANLFSFTCSFSAAAVKGGAEVCFSVDLAGSALERGKENFALNRLDESGRGKFVKEDVRKWLDRELRKKERLGSEYRSWDLVVCDPPVFASGKGGQFSVEQQWPGLAESIAQIMSKDGIALFANNHRGGDSRFYRTELEKRFSSVEEIRPPLDFPAAGDGVHVRIYLCQ